jgi:hypothetical protein
VTAGVPLRRVTAALVSDPRRRVELTSDGNGFSGVLPFAGPVRVVVSDQARNESDRVVDLAAFTAGQELR